MERPRPSIRDQRNEKILDRANNSFRAHRRALLMEEIREAAVGLIEGTRDEDLLLHPGDVAEIFNVDMKTLRKWADNGQLPTIRTLGNHRRYSALAIWSKIENEGEIPYDSSLTTGDVAVMFNVSHKSVRKWNEEGKLSSLRTVGGHRRFSEEEVANIVREDPEVIDGAYNLSVGDIISLFKVSARAVRCWADEGKLSSIRTLGGHRRFMASEVIELLRQAEGKMQDGALLTTGEVAKLLRVTQRTVRNWEETGKLTGLKTPGGHRRFSASEVQELLRDR